LPATILGQVYSRLEPGALALRIDGSFIPEEKSLNGYVFKPGETPAVNAGVLQLGATGMGLLNQPTFHFGTWGFSPCSTFSCGGGPFSGVYTMAAEPNVVPLPAAFPLLVAGLGGLGLVARRRRSAPAARCRSCLP
jgi:hypothetical protein